MKQEEILKAIEFIIYKYYNYYKMCGVDKDDLIQEGYEIYYNLLAKSPKKKITMEMLTSYLRYYLSQYLEKAKPKNVSFLTKDLMEFDWLPDTNNDPETWHELKEMWSLIGDALETLNEREKHIIFSVYLADLPKTADELAVELKISRQRVYQIIAKSEKKIAEYLGVDK